MMRQKGEKAKKVELQWELTMEGQSGGGVN